MTIELKWISDKDLLEICKNIVDKANDKADTGLDFNNIVDPFSALFDIFINNISYDEWTKLENVRQKQKSLQNMIGTFHQKVIGKVNGWEDLKVGNVVDLCNRDKKIIAEVKNKHNTTKGNHKVAVYDDLKAILSKPEFHGFTGYYVTVLSRNKCNKPFTPSDNKVKKRRDIDENIREVDGATFYEIATDRKNALADIYARLPYILCKLTKKNPEDIIKDPMFAELFEKAIK